MYIVPKNSNLDKSFMKVVLLSSGSSVCDSKSFDCCASLSSRLALVVESFFLAVGPVQGPVFVTSKVCFRGTYP